MIRRHSHTLPTDKTVIARIQIMSSAGHSPPAMPSVVRRRALWIQGTCLQNRNWFLKKADRMGHEATGKTVWDAFLKPGTI